MDTLPRELLEKIGKYLPRDANYHGMFLNKKCCNDEKFRYKFSCDCEKCKNTCCQSCEYEEECDYCSTRCDICLDRCDFCKILFISDCFTDKCEFCGIKMCEECGQENQDFLKSKFTSRCDISNCYHCRSGNCYNNKTKDVCRTCRENGNFSDSDNESLIQTRYNDYIIEQENRRNILSQKLAEYKLRIREDSKLCQQYIEYGQNDLDYIVNRMCEMKYLFEYLKVQKTIQKIKNKKIYYRNVLDEAERRLLQKNSYPETWPWM